MPCLLCRLKPLGESVFASLCDFGSRQRERSPAMICVAGDSFGQNHEHHREMEKMVREINKKYFGFEDWYDWCLSNWGTKWDVGHNDQGTRAEIHNGCFTVNFDSAWSPPVAAYEKLEEMGYLVVAYYFEPGCDFCGKYAHGVDECCRVEDRTEEVDEVMGISDTIAEWEAQS